MAAPDAAPVAPSNAPPRSVPIVSKELEKCENELNKLRMELKEKAGPEQTAKKRAQMNQRVKKLGVREKELGIELKRARQQLELDTLGEALRKAVTRNDIDSVKEMCSQPNAAAFVNSSNFEGTTSLTKASMKDLAEIVAVLHSAGAALEGVDDLGRTALMMAAGNGAEAATRRLVELGSSPTTTAENGWTAFMFAAEGGHANVCQCLLEVSQPDVLMKYGGWTAIELARASRAAGKDAVIDLLEPLVEEAEKAAASAGAGAGTEGWKQLRRLSRLSQAASAFDAKQMASLAEEESRPRGAFASLLRQSEDLKENAFSLLRGVASAVQQSFVKKREGSFFKSEAIAMSFTRRLKARASMGKEPAQTSLFGKPPPRESPTSVVSAPNIV